MITIVTALYDIKRSVNGDGRTFDEYLSWFGQTLKVKSPMVVYVSPEHEEFVLSHRKGLPTKVITQKLEDVPYYYLNQDIQNILDDKTFIEKIGAPSRVECKMSLYNVIIYSKFKWVQETVLNNYFNTEYFMWMDAGLSRFFGGVDLSQKYPGDSAEEALLDAKDKILIQASMSPYPDLVNAQETTEEYFWDARTWIMAGLWGGGKDVMLKFIDDIDDVLRNKMIRNGVINNEQNAMAYLYKNNPDMFIAFENYSHMHRQYEIINEIAK